MFRKFLFWSHLTAGLFVALFVAFMSVTGAALAFEPQIMRYFERHLLLDQGSTASAPLSPGELMMAVQQQTSRPVGALQIFSDRTLPAQVQFGKEDILFVDPRTGRVLYGAATKARSLLTTIRNLHAYASLEHERDGVLLELKNAANLGFCFLIASGLVLWIPRKCRVANIRAVTVLRTNLRGRARDWNWHNVTGFWLALPLVVMSATGAIMSYSWAEALLYRAAGTPIPVRNSDQETISQRTENKRQDQERNDGSLREGGGAIEKRGEIPVQSAPRMDPEAGAHDHEEGEARREDKSKFGGKKDHGERRGLTRPLTAHELLALNPLLETAKTKMPSWQNIRLRIVGKSARVVSFTFDDDESQGKGQRCELQMDRLSGEILQWTPPTEAPTGQRWRAYARFLHTGEALGIAGQLTAFTAALAAVLLASTGLALSLRRFFAWRARLATTGADSVFGRARKLIPRPWFIPGRPQESPSSHSRCEPRE
jgi:uncharacterized iron-regulated membrane protein